ncbi:MAG: hypothetical protein KDA71_03755 [Planctomycetales bacterium]|nr:hypothetical protein [Planctomycetales bacterium]
MGGHAARFYGVERNTNDFDLHLSPDCWDDIKAKIQASPLATNFKVVEGPSWRPGAFRRFQIGVLPSGREEWLEFWRHNHLLPDFHEVFDRREIGVYGGRKIAFLGLRDLIRAKETERESDWQDIALLEEFADSRDFSAVFSGDLDLPNALSRIRSRRGFESHLKASHFRDDNAIRQAVELTASPITEAFLTPVASRNRDAHFPIAAIEPVVRNRLSEVDPGTNLHFALVEIVRRRYKLAAQAADRADKESIRRTLAAPSDGGAS